MLVIVEGADAAGKTTLIERAMARRAGSRRVALGPPTARERSQWYFQRWIAQLPADGETVFFDRSWYNRAALEPLHGFCTPAETEAFFSAVPRVERLLVDDGIRLIKLLLEVGPEEQARRLAGRAALTPIDRDAPRLWAATRDAHVRMIARTGPWIVVPEGDDALAALQGVW